MRTDIAGLAVIALLGATAYLLFAPYSDLGQSAFWCSLNYAQLRYPNCVGWTGHFWLALTTLAAAIWLTWRVRRRSG